MNLINDLLDLQLIKRGILVAHADNYSLKVILNEAANLMVNKIKEKGLVFKVEILDNLEDEYIYIDQQRFT